MLSTWEVLQLCFEAYTAGYLDPKEAGDLSKIAFA
jgi:hypothetical protein